MNPNCSSFIPSFSLSGTQALPPSAQYYAAGKDASPQQTQEAVPQYASTHSDILCDFFTKVNLWDAQGRPNFDTRIRIPPFNFSESLGPLLTLSKKKHLTTLDVLKRIRQFTEDQGMSAITFTFQDGNLPVFFDRCGYLHQIFYNIGVHLPFDIGRILDSRMQHQSPECLVWVSHTQDLESIWDFLRYKLSIPCKIEDNSITLTFNSHYAQNVKIRVLLNGTPCQEDLSLDITGFIKDIHSPSQLVVKNPNTWQGILHFVTALSNEKNWLQLVHQYTKGKRTLCHEDEAIVLNIFNSSLPASASVKTIAKRFLQEFPTSVVHDGNTFLTIAIQLISSSQFTDTEAAGFLDEILPHLRDLTPITDPILRRAVPCFRKSIPFSHVKAILVLSALKGTIQTSRHFSSTVVQSAGQECLQLQLLESEQTLLLPFSPRQAFEVLQYAGLALPESRELKTLYLAAMSSFDKPVPNHRLSDFVRSHQAYHDLHNVIDSSSARSAPMLAHFCLTAAERTYLQKTLLQHFTNLFSSEFRRDYFNSLRRHPSPMISQLAQTIADSEDSPKKAMELMN